MRILIGTALLAIAGFIFIAATATPTPDPVAGDVHAETECIWVENSYTKMFGAIVGDEVALRPTAMVQDWILNGIPEDGSTHDFQWRYFPTYDRRLPLSQAILVKGRGQDLVVQHRRNYANMVRWLKIHISPMWDPTGLRVLESPFSRGVWYIQSLAATGDDWAFIPAVGGYGDEGTRVVYTSCFHILPDSTPTGHEPFIQ